jgi:hypothetical protein
MPTMLCEIVRGAAEAVPGAEVVADLPAGRLDAPVAVEILVAEPDVVVAAADSVSEAGVIDLLGRRFRIRIVGISQSATEATLFEMRPHRISLGEVGLETLRTVLGGGKPSGRDGATVEDGGP